MPKYRVYLTTVTEVGIDVEAEDPEAAQELAHDQAPSLCAQCSGWGQSWSRDESDEWELEAVTDESGAEVWTSGECWSRVAERS